MHHIGTRKKVLTALWIYISRESQPFEKFDFDINAMIVLQEKPPRKIMNYVPL